MQRRVPLSDNQSKLRAWFVHAYTALGLPCAFLALLAAYQGNAHDVFIFFVIALLIDGTDGPMARRFDVKRWTPNFDGRKLDDIIDYLTYTLVPIFFIWRFQLVEGQLAAVLILALLCSAYGFCSDGAKTDDKHFTGFPSYWNVVALFLYALRMPQPVNAAIIIFLALLTLTPVKFPSSQAVKPFERMVIVLSGFLGLALVLNIDSPPQALVYAALAYPLYHLVSSIVFYLRDELREHNR
jgi:phosphatidylcholine synthase